MDGAPDVKIVPAVWELAGETKGESRLELPYSTLATCNLPSTLRCKVSPIAGIASDSRGRFGGGATGAKSGESRLNSPISISSEPTPEGAHRPRFILDRKSTRLNSS